MSIHFGRVGILLSNLLTTVGRVGLTSIVTVLLGLHAAQADSPPPPMTTPGQFSVSSTGAFTYTIPIKVPPGTAGMAPSLSLDYSSGSGDGLEGIGWTLNGLPSVTRCPSTIAQDTVHGAVNFDQYDHYCLEGQRLVSIGSVVTGSLCGSVAGTEYRTEIEGFSRIVGCGSPGSGGFGPLFFKVWTKSGQVMEFGNTADSRPLPVIANLDGTIGNTLPSVRVWAVNKISDTKGNYLTVTYNGNSDYCTANDVTHNGELCPTLIKYTANSNAGLSANFSVQFKYVTRTTTDITPVYQAGTMQQLTLWLSDIITCTSSTPSCPSASVVSDYHLSYSTFTNSNINISCCGHIRQIKLCADTGLSNCLPATTFTWQGTDPTTPTHGDPNPNSLAGNNTQHKPNNFNADYDGDGLSDATVLVPHSSACSSNYTLASPYFGTQDGETFNADYPGTSALMKVDFTLTGTDNSDYCTGSAAFADTFTTEADIDGDGFTDIIEQKPNSGDRFVLWNNRVGTFNSVLLTNGAYLWADFTGDGRTDYLKDTSSGNRTDFEAFQSNFPTSNTFAELTNIGNAGDVHVDNSSSSYFAGDFDGDGCSDVLTQGGTSRIYDICDWSHNVGVNGDDSVPNWMRYGHNLAFGDFNGDGKTDVLRWGNNDSLCIYLSDGRGFITPSDPGPWCDSSEKLDGNYFVTVGDWNADGKADFAVIPRNADGNPHTIAFYLSTGNAIRQFLSVDTIDGARRGVVAGDWNSDGAGDLWIQATSTDGKTNLDTEYFFNYQPLLIQKVDNGIGVSTTVNYDRINESTDASGTFYQKGSGATYPTQDIDGPMYVVREIDSGNGLGTCDPPNTDKTYCYVSTYSYAGLQADLTGRGLLGFSSVSITDSQTGIVQTTTYHTQYPFTGLIASQTKTCASGCSGPAGLLSKTVNCYGTTSTDCTTPAAPEAITIRGPDINRYFLPLRQTTKIAYDTDGTALPTVTTTYGYDCDAGTDPCYGLTSTVAVTTTLGSDTASKTTANTYYSPSQYASGTWIIDRLQQSTVTADATINGNTAPTIVRTSSFVYDTSSGLLTHETIEANDTGCLYLDTQYDYDSAGLRNKVKVTQTAKSGCGAQRISQAGYALDTTHFGQFATTIINAYSQSETWDYVTGNYTTNAGQAFGVPLGHTGPNGISTFWHYDGFGRKTEEDRADGTKSVTAFAYCSSLPSNPPIATCPTNAQFVEYTTPETSMGAQIGPVAVTFYDGLSRVLATDVQGFDGALTYCPGCWIRTETNYDSYGRVQRTSRPHFVGDTRYWTTNSYLTAAGVNDPLGRIQKVTPPGPNGSTTTVYSGLTTTVTNAKNQVTTTLKNVLGLVETVTDALANQTNYTYDAEGDLLKVMDPSPAHNTSTFYYDLRGRKTDSFDPDMGHWTYSYDAYGDMVKQVDAKAQTTFLSYDLLGRLVQKQELAVGGGWQYDNWVYNDGLNGTNHDIGLLINSCRRATSSTDCSSLASTDYLRHYTYDTLSRPWNVTLHINGTAYTYETDYDGVNGRVADVVRPSGLQIDNVYTPLGYLNQLKDHGTATAVWTADQRDAEMHLLESTAGNGVNTLNSFDPNTGLIQQTLAGEQNNNVADFSYTFDKLGNLTFRSDVLSGPQATEISCYDALNRLVKYSLGGSMCGDGSDRKLIEYDAIGNITRKSDVSVVGGYHYDGAGPHQLSSILTCSGCTVNGVANPSFTYDANGNMLTGAGRTVTYTSFNMANTLSNGVTIATFHYDSEHQRIEQQITAPAGGGDTLYINGMGEMEELYTASSTTWRDYIEADGHLVAERFATVGGSTTYSYFVLDHLGSVSVVTDASGNVTERDAYDAWGKRRNPDWSDDPTCTLTSQTTRGFTGHEEMDRLCLVNMNARIYDPVVGRFMAADPTVEAIYDPQDLNRYTYVGNNPLSLTDPSGLCFLGCFWQTPMGRQAIGLVAAFTLQEWALPAIELAGLAAGAQLTAGQVVLNAGISGGVSGYISTGKLNGALMGAAESVAFASVHFAKVDMGFPGDPSMYSPAQMAESAAMHGMVGGLFSVANRGGFGSGFLAAGLSDLADGTDAKDPNMLDMAKHAIVGGIGSELGGGKFANGAMTGAFGYLFNGMLGRAIGGQIGAWIAGIGGSETGPLDIAIIAAGRFVGGEIGSDIEDRYFSSNGPTGGRLGISSTRALDAGIADGLEKGNYTIEGGGGRNAQEYIPGSGPGTRGSTFVDITARHNETGAVVRVQTIDTRADGSPTSREGAAAGRIQARYPNDKLYLVPKRD